jgi:hypothetical protein
MKYSIKAFSISYESGFNKTMLIFKGPFYYRLNGKKGKLVFPWHVNKIELESANLLPALFIGWKGKRSFTIHEVTAPATWKPQNNWTQVTTTELASVDGYELINTESLENIVNSINLNSKFVKPDLSNLPIPNVKVPELDLTQLQLLNIPQKICQLNNQ